MSTPTQTENPAQTGPDTPQTSPEPGSEQSGDGAQKTTEDKAKPVRAKAPDTSKITADGINAATLAVPGLIEASAPVRERSTEQKLMDAVAIKAYEAWRNAKKPAVWAKMPVVTYFLDADEVAAYKYLIRRACAIVEPADGATGVRVRFGNEFTLSEEMAKKLNLDPKLAGKTVVAWTAIDKREVAEDSKKKNLAVTAATAKHDAKDAPSKPDRTSKK